MGGFLIAVAAVMLYGVYLGSDNIKAGGSLLASELWGNNHPYLKWLGAIIIIGALGYVPDFKPVSTGLLVLITVAILLSHNNALTTLIADL